MDIEIFHFYRPQTKFAKVMFLQVSVILSTGGGIQACIAGGIPACLAAGLQGVVSQYALQVSRPTPRGEVEGSGRKGGGSPGPHPRGNLRGLAWGGACSGGGDPPPVTATAVGGTRPTGMHSCSIMYPGKNSP